MWECGAGTIIARTLWGVRVVSILAPFAMLDPN